MYQQINQMHLECKKKEAAIALYFKAIASGKFSPEVCNGLQRLINIARKEIAFLKIQIQEARKATLA